MLDILTIIGKYPLNPKKGFLKTVVGQIRTCMSVARSSVETSDPICTKLAQKMDE